MRRFLPLVIFVVLIGSALAIRFWVATDNPVVARAPPPAAPQPSAPISNPPQNAALATSAAPGLVQKPASNPLLPPLQEVQIDAHTPHNVPSEPVSHVERDVHLPPVPHPNANFYAGSGSSNVSPFGNRPSNLGTTRDNAPKQFSGRARVTESTGLVVGAVSVQLFGVQSLPLAERCGPYRCVSVAIAALNSRLARNPTVFCRSPLAGQGVTYAICLDSEGADLGGYLVGEGLAKADPGQSYDYVGAERIAHDLHRGIWKR